MVDVAAGSASRAAVRGTGDSVKPLVRLVLISLFASFALAACNEPPVEAPAVNAASSTMISGKVVYQRGSDVYVQEIGGTPRRLLDGASYPRWSPDGRMVAAVGGNRIHVVDAESGESKAIAKARSPQTLAWHPSGASIFFSDGDRIREVDVRNGTDRVVLSGHRILELDVGPDGRTLVGTRQRLGYSIMVFDLESGEARKLESGCSASFSPDGSLVTNLLDGHRRLALLSTGDGSRNRVLAAPEGIKYDNQYWTNHPDWIAGETEGSTTDIVLIHARDGRVRKVTSVGNASRGDVFIRIDAGS